MLSQRSFAFVLVGLAACGGEDRAPVPQPAIECAPPLEEGDPIGHADPFGARAAGQARAGRVDDLTALPGPLHGRQPYLPGDYVLINEHVAAVIEGVRPDDRPSDGYARFGGELAGLDLVGEDGRPRGLSRYNETLIGLGTATVDPDTVTVLADGSDGGAAIVRVSGRLAPIPFLDGPVGALFPQIDPYEVAFDYVLEPGAHAVTLRMAVRNLDPEAVDLGVERAASDEIVGFFQTSQHQLVTPSRGFEAGTDEWYGFVSDGAGFAWRPVDGPLEQGIGISGFELTHGPGFRVEGCSADAVDRVEIVVGGPRYDGLREAVRRQDGGEGIAFSGVVVDAGGAPVADAWVHALDGEAYLSRTRTDGEGAFTLHAPDADPLTLVAQKAGYAHPGATVDPSGDATLTFEPHATLRVDVRDESGQVLPSRVQVIPAAPIADAPPVFGVQGEARGRLHQAFLTTAAVELPVPPGEHRVVVSRGYEYELSDQTVTVTAGETSQLDVVLDHSVDSTGVMCADFHIHTYHSADSSDPFPRKVAGAVADGLEIPCSSEHEWVADFAPVVEDLGLSAWAFGMSSSELTTFSWGHFGVVPLRARPGTLNQGAVDWIGKDPSEVFDMVDALEEAPALVVNHPRGLGIGGYFSATSFDSVTGQSASPLWSENFDAVEVFNDSDLDDNRQDSVADWFALLRRGKRVSAVGNSDSHSIRTSPVGYPRTCFPFGTDDPQQLDDLRVRDELLAGSAVISGGLTMRVQGPGGEGPGASIAAGPSTFTVTIESPSWIEADELEVILSGETHSVVPLVDVGAGPAHRYEATVDLDTLAGDFVVFHARGVGDLAPLHPGRRPFAVSNPIFVAGAAQAPPPRGFVAPKPPAPRPRRHHHDAHGHHHDEPGHHEAPRHGHHHHGGAHHPGGHHH